MPPRPWRGEKGNERRNVIGQTQKQARGDPRQGKTGASLTRNDLVTTAQSTIPITVVAQQRNMWNFAMGYVTKALEKGFATSALNEWDPFFAFIYAVNLLTQYQSNSVPPAIELPYILHSFGRAMVTKSVGFANGKITYTMVPGGVGEPPIQIGIGYQAYGYKYNLTWVPESPTLTGPFPNLVSTGLPTYTEEQGAAAFAEMNTFLTGAGADTDFNAVSSGSPTAWDKDVSAFALVQQQQGVGAGDVGSGGFGVQSQLEVPMFRPLLTLLTPQQENILVASANRYPNLTVSQAGDPTVLGGLAGHTIPLKAFGMKRPLKFHCVDFNEYLETIAFWVSGIQQAAVQDPLNPEQNAISALQCPLTLQEVSFLLRNAFMEVFKDTQAGVQGLYPEVPASNTDNQFVPFTASAGTCFLQSVPFQLPVGLVECMRATAFRIASRGKKDLEYFVPVVGQYVNDVISSADFTYTSIPNGGDETFTSFVIPSMAKYKKKVFNEKTGVVEEMVVPETPINLIDGGAPGVWVAVNNPASLVMLAREWDKWLKDTGLQTYSSTLTTVSAEKGINVLFNGNMTRHWIVASGGQKESRRMVSERFCGKKNASVLTSPYLLRSVIADTAQSIPLAAPYSQVQKIWILPSIESEINFTLPPNSTQANRWQILMSEPYLINSSSGFDGISMTEMHSQFAQKMVKGRDSPPDNWDNFFVEAAKQGRGGVLSSLIAGAIGSFLPAAAPILNTIADILPV